MFPLHSSGNFSPFGNVRAFLGKRLDMIKDIEQKSIEKYGSFRKFCIENGHDYSNFKRKLIANLDKINKWLGPLGIELQISRKA